MLTKIISNKRRLKKKYMDYIMGENIDINECINGDFLITVNNADVEILMTSYEATRFMYLLRSYLQNTADENTVMYIPLRSVYTIEYEQYYANIWLSRDDDYSIIINMQFVKVNDEQNIENESQQQLSVKISLEGAQYLIKEYINIEYEKLLTDD